MVFLQKVNCDFLQTYHNHQELSKLFTDNPLVIFVLVCQKYGGAGYLYALVPFQIGDGFDASYRFDIGHLAKLMQ